MPSPASDMYSLRAPPWRARLNGLAPRLGWPDLFPAVAGTSPEMTITPATARSGYTAKPATKNEGFSAHDLIYDRLHPTQHLVAPLLAEVAARQAELARASALPPRPAQLPAWPRVTLNEAKLQAYLRDLADPTVPLARLARSVPHGIRGERLIEMLYLARPPPAQENEPKPASSSATPATPELGTPAGTPTSAAQGCVPTPVPIARAAWFLHTVGATDLQSARAKPPPVAVDLTQALATALKRLIDAIPAPSDSAPLLSAALTHTAATSPSAPSPPAGISSSFATPQWTHRLGYMLTLSRVMGDLGLLHPPTWLRISCELLGPAHAGQVAFVLPLLQGGVALFPEGRAPLPLARLALAALARSHATLSTAIASLEGDGHALAVSLVRQITSLARELVLSSPRVLVGPRLWAAHGAALPSVLGLGDRNPEDAYLRELLQRAHKRVNRITLLDFALRPPPVHTTFDTAVSLNQLLDALDPGCDPGVVFVLLFGLASTPTQTQRRVEDLLLWACSPSHFQHDEAQDWPAGSAGAAARVALVSCWLVYLHGCGGDVPAWLEARTAAGEISKEEQSSLLAQAIPIPCTGEEEPRLRRPKPKPFSLDAFLPAWLEEVQQAHCPPQEEPPPSQPSKISLPLPRPSPPRSLSSLARGAVEFAPLASLVESMLALGVATYATLLRAAAPGFRTGQPSLISRVVRSVALPLGEDGGLRRRTIYPNRARERETWDEAMARRSARELEALFPFIRGDFLREDEAPFAHLREQVQTSLPHLWDSTPYVQRIALAPLVTALGKLLSEWRPFSPSLGAADLQRVLLVLHQADDWDALAQVLLVVLHDLAAQETVRYSAALPLVQSYVVSHALLWTARGELATMTLSLSQCARYTSPHSRETVRWARQVLLSLARTGNVAAQEAVRDMREPPPLDSVPGGSPALRGGFYEARSEALSTLQACADRPQELAAALHALQGSAEPATLAAVQVSVQLHISVEGPDPPPALKLTAAGLNALDQAILKLVHDTGIDVDATLAAALESVATGTLLRALPALTPLFVGLLKEQAVGMDTLVSSIIIPCLHSVEHQGSDQLLRFLHDLALAGHKMCLPLGREVFRALSKGAPKDPNPLPLLLEVIDLTHPPHRPILWGELRHPQFWREGIRAVAMGHGSAHPPPPLAGGPIAALVTPGSIHMALERISALPAAPLAASSPLTGLPQRRPDESEESTLASILVERLFSPTSTQAGEQALALAPPSLSNRVHTLLLTALVRAVEAVTDPSRVEEKDLALAEAALSQLVRTRHLLGLRTVTPSDVPYWSALIHAVLKLLTAGENAAETEKITTLAVECLWLLCQPSEWWTASPAVRGIIPRLYARLVRVLIASASRGETSMVALCLDSLLVMLEEAPASLVTLCQQGVSLTSPEGQGRDLSWLTSLPPALAQDVARVLLLPPQGDKVVLAPSLSVAVREAYFTPVGTKAWQLVPSLRPAEGSAAPPGTEAYTTRYDPLAPIPDQGALSLASFAARKERDGPRLHLLPHPRPVAPHDDSMVSRSIEAERSYGTYATDPPEIRAVRIQAPDLLRYQSEVEEKARILDSSPPRVEEERDPTPLPSTSEVDSTSPVSSELSESEPEPEESPPVSPARSMLLKHKSPSVAPSPLAQSPRSPLPSPRKEVQASSAAASPAEDDSMPPARKKPRPRPARPKDSPPSAPGSDPAASTPILVPVDPPAAAPAAGKKRKATSTAPSKGRTPRASPALAKLPDVTLQRRRDSVQLIPPPASAPASAPAPIPAAAPVPSPAPVPVQVSAQLAAPVPPIHAVTSGAWASPAPYAALFPNSTGLLGVNALPAQPPHPAAPLAGPAAVVGTVAPSLESQDGVPSSEDARNRARSRSRGTPRIQARGTTKRPARGRPKLQTSEALPDASVPSLTPARPAESRMTVPQYAGTMPGMEWGQDSSRLLSNMPSAVNMPNMHNAPNVSMASSLHASPVHTGSLTVPLQQGVDPRLSPIPFSQGGLPQSVQQTAVPSQLGVPSQGMDPYLPSGSSQGPDLFFGTSFFEPTGMDAQLGQGFDPWFPGMFGYNGASTGVGGGGQDDRSTSNWNFLT